MRAKYTRWIEEEEKYVLENFGKMPYKEMAEYLNKTTAQINSKMQYFDRHGLIKRDKRRKKTHKVNQEYVEEFGLNLSEIKLKIGKEYEVFMPKQENAKLDDFFKGILIQDTPRHITLKNKLGYCQSFLKADILMKIVQVKEVSQ
ncbi:hypothetical protein ACR77J_12220 [Tissierella praeacuta]|uniref:hypothetical protein n=1 Tax=Tissierella praeacuta TaxID=43131 RepID=UPI003DA515A6